MKPLWITYHDGTEPYVSLGRKLCQSITAADAGITHMLDLKPNGGNLFAEAMGRSYAAFSDAIVDRPVILIDADCEVQKAIPAEALNSWPICAVHRGKCSNSMGDQSYLSTIVFFGNKDPNWARHLWLGWAEKIMAFQLLGFPVKQGATRNRILRARGWASNWFCDQSALNQMLREIESADVPVGRLLRDEYAARPGNEGAYIIHRKGEGKLK